jgi:hypothetical protein
LNSESREGYARLPEDLLRDLLIDADAVVGEVDRLLRPAIERRHEFREALVELDLIRTHAIGETLSVSGVDGGFAIERTSSVDLLLCVAVGVEGLAASTTYWDGTQYEWWSQVAEHDFEADRLARGIMISQELAVLDSAPHDLKVLDGSHLTLVIQLNSAMSAESPKVRKGALEKWESLRTVEALGRVVSAPDVIAMPKYDSSAEIVRQLGAHLGEQIPGDDKLLLGALLEPGELIVPQPVPEKWKDLHFSARDDKPLEEQFMDAIAPLKDGRMRFTYFKPDEFSPAFRIELKNAVSEHQLDSLCTTIASQITGPFIREPYPQYLADVMAKSVGLGLSALKSAVQLGLSESGRPEIAELLIRSYRTEGV